MKRPHNAAAGDIYARSVANGEMTRYLNLNDLYQCICWYTSVADRSDKS